MAITLDKGITDRLNQGMNLGDAVELPFPVIYLWAVNGQTSYKSQGGAMYYGGWACKTEEIAAYTEAQGLSVPQGWKEVDMASRDGDEFAAFTTRHVLVAPIAQRESWIGRDGQRHMHYVDGARRHLQVLAYLPEIRTGNGTKQYIPWGPVVLTAKGYQALNLADSFTRWNKATASIRRKIAPGIPAWCFYLAVGTFEKERQVINVGKAGAQSPITPIGPYIPGDLSDDVVSNLFVGGDVAAMMADYSDQAQEWLNAWKGDGKPKNGNGSSEDDQFVYGDNVAPEDEQPF